MQGERMWPLGPGGEFDFIRTVLRSAPALGDQVRVGPGDDAAVVGEGWVVSTDLSVEDVHFRRSWITDVEIGYRAATAALSDLAAMAADPVGVLVSLAAPAGGEVDPVAVSRGVQEAAAVVGAAVLGGDFSRSPGPLFVDVTVLGRAEEPALRRGGRPGDELWVTGSLGAASAAVARWNAGGEPGELLRRAFARPVARTAAARTLASAGVVRAMVDLSDGLAGDAAHLGAAGGVRVVLYGDAIPVATAAAVALGGRDALTAALHGGEDYELCFAAPAGSVDAASLGAAAGVPLTRVGHLEEGEGVWLRAGDGSLARLARGGHDHVDGDRR